MQRGIFSETCALRKLKKKKNEKEVETFSSPNVSAESEFLENRLNWLIV